jgi:hypothetical protein
MSVAVCSPLRKIRSVPKSAVPHSLSRKPHKVEICDKIVRLEAATRQRFGAGGNTLLGFSTPPWATGRKFVRLRGPAVRPERVFAGQVYGKGLVPLAEWTARHNRWADGEVAESEDESREGRLKPDARGNPAERKRFLRANTTGCLSLSGRSSFLSIDSSFASVASMEPRG